MVHFLQAVVHPLAALTLFAWVFALAGPVWGYYKDRSGGWGWPLLWAIVAIINFISWWFLVFGG